MENMEIYQQMIKTPAEAKKEITAGRLKGMTDINPMYRIKKLTEVFGACGTGWNTQNVQYQRQECSNGEAAIICTLELVYKVNGEWSAPVFGVGGSKLIMNEQRGIYLNDEAYKMAYTDAISIACKSLGMCHDIYFAKDRTKYDLPADDEKTVTIKNTPPTTAKPAKVSVGDTVPPVCGSPTLLTATTIVTQYLKSHNMDAGTFKKHWDALIAGGVPNIPNKPTKEMTAQEAKTLVDAIEANRGAA